MNIEALPSKFLKPLFTLALSVWLLGSMSLAHAGSCTADGCNGLIDLLYVQATGDVYVATDGTESALGCSAVSGVYITLQRSAGNFNHLFGLLTAAQLSGRPVYLRIVNGSAGCTVGYVTMSR